MIGARCADLIAEAVTAMEFKASAEDISRMFMRILLLQKRLKSRTCCTTDNVCN
jgi:dihydrolipoamide dehydrogenase